MHREPKKKLCHILVNQSLQAFLMLLLQATTQGFLTKVQKTVAWKWLSSIIFVHLQFSTYYIFFLPTTNFICGVWFFLWYHFDVSCSNVISVNKYYLRIRPMLRFESKLIENEITHEWITHLARHRSDNAGVIYVESLNPTSDCCYSNVMTLIWCKYRQ